MLQKLTNKQKEDNNIHIDLCKRKLKASWIFDSPNVWIVKELLLAPKEVTRLLLLIPTRVTHSLLYGKSDRDQIQ